MLSQGNPNAVNAFLQMAMRNRAAREAPRQRLAEIATQFQSQQGQSALQRAGQEFATSERVAEQAYDAEARKDRERLELERDAVARMQGRTDNRALAGAVGLDPEMAAGVSPDAFRVLASTTLAQSQAAAARAAEEAEAAQIAGLLAPHRSQGPAFMPTFGPALGGVRPPMVGTERPATRQDLPGRAAALGRALRPGALRAASQALPEAPSAPAEWKPRTMREAVEFERERAGARATTERATGDDQPIPGEILPLLARKYGIEAGALRPGMTYRELKALGVDVDEQMLTQLRLLTAQRGVADYVPRPVEDWQKKLTRLETEYRDFLNSMATASQLASRDEMKVRAEELKAELEAHRASRPSVAPVGGTPAAPGAAPQAAPPGWEQLPDGSFRKVAR